MDDLISNEEVLDIYKAEYMKFIINRAKGNAISHDLTKREEKYL
jgi:hypothetical protein